MIRYFFFIETNPKSPNYRKPISVHRMRRDESGAHPEWWNGKEWEWNTHVIAAWGIGGDNDYEATTEEKAMRFIASKKEAEK
jgi:hypothetical protein